MLFRSTEGLLLYSGLVMAARGDQPAAMGQLSLLTELKPSTGAYHSLVADNMAREDRFEDAVASYETAIKLGADTSAARRRMAGPPARTGPTPGAEPPRGGVGTMRASERRRTAQPARPPDCPDCPDCPDYRR